MQIDMHYYGVFALARAAGINVETAKRIADASQDVDDYTQEGGIENADGALISFWPSGHGLVCDANFDALGEKNSDPHKVWVPFHFIPGNEGPSYQERMRCSKDGVIVNDAIRHVIDHCSENSSAPELIGCLAHVYADTFSHWGFAGLRSNGNLVEPQSIELLGVQDAEIFAYLINKASDYFDQLSAAVAGASTRYLGHSSVADYPDRPYLRWRFKYALGPSSPIHDNQNTYTEACEKLFSLFTQFKAVDSIYAEKGIKNTFEDIRGAIHEIVAFEGKKEERSQKWKDAVMSGKLLISGEFPDHVNDIDNDIAECKIKTVDETRDSRAWHFTSAIDYIRSLVCDDLIPKYGLIP